MLNKLIGRAIASVRFWSVSPGKTWPGEVGEGNVMSVVINAVGKAPLLESLEKGIAVVG